MHFIYLAFDTVVTSFINWMHIVNRPYWSLCCM